MIRVILPLLLLLTPAAAIAETRVPASQAEISLGFAPVVKRAAPAVVNIYAKIITSGQPNPFFSDPFFQDFFGGFGAPQQRVQNSLGSGVILSDDGYVVSNYHVVGMASEIQVVTTDRREYSATVVLGDEESDIAILRLDQASDLPSLALRDSDQVEVGELVLAIGNPFGVGQTVSSGIVSGLARSGAATGKARGYFLQTDAPINPGNSGGALIDVNGDLIGINTSILSRSGGSNGIGFAIPANLVREFLRQARQGNEYFVRPWAGIAGQPMNADIADSLGLALPEGVVISDIHAVSPLTQAGFKVGDVVTHVDGEPVNSPSEMMFRMSVTGIGGVSTMTRLRDGEREELGVAMIEAPDEPPAEDIKLDDQTALPGLVVARANPAVISYLGLPLSAEGVVVIDPGPYGARAGLQHGDIVAGINGEDMLTTTDVRKALTDTGRWVRLDLQRRGQKLSLRFRL
ncbi:Periplasmic pH-dependent serine endoprotease DegQ precursor [Falsiruegeria litorea R37]|uniref:Periplasmic pH-dependent serine endoprotease DegQ n=1 Tax=Falsiruegeria litorea R37 TaxID=1200284 RepID=A0A1Y5RK60_9RHOB|nr:trypsin-like peptidase domain-containing protein [Falsiruegeria litorea]SLN18290.1 Periplasmic pH-dependent serine endoprotease DegQ precursor [Falsiruegeria litorea R37]